MSEAKKLLLKTFKLFIFSLYYKKKIFWTPKMQITANFDVILKNDFFLQFFGVKNDFVI